MSVLPTIFACSPRARGNSDTAAQTFLDGLTQAGGQGALVHLRKHDPAGCKGCYGCAKDLAGRCVQPDAPRLHDLFTPLLEAPVVCFASPIFFYHVPAQFKAFIDRSQPYYLRWMAGDPALRNLPRRPAYAILVAGRPSGEKLFEGALLTLKYFLINFNLHLAGTLTFRGIDQPGDLAENSEALAAIRDLGAQAWSERAGR